MTPSDVDEIEARIRKSADGFYGTSTAVVDDMEDLISALREAWAERDAAIRLAALAHGERDAARDALRELGSRE